MQESVQAPPLLPVEVESGEVPDIGLALAQHLLDLFEDVCCCGFKAVLVNGKLPDLARPALDLLANLSGVTLHPV
jgi:hypothetical protein